MGKNVAIFGATGGIGSALLDLYRKAPNVETIYAFSRKPLALDDPKISKKQIDLEEETSIISALPSEELDEIIVATGILHEGEVVPEKALKELEQKSLHHLYAVDCVGPALIAKHFIPKMRKGGRSVFAAISARVGSISDNALGGWYSYRMAKAALNMFLKSLSIELKRTHPSCIALGLHPGTVKSSLSAPYQKSGLQLFTPEESASRLLNVIDNATIEHSGKCYAYDGKEILP